MTARTFSEGSSAPGVPHEQVQTKNMHPATTVRRAETPVLGTMNASLPGPKAVVFSPRYLATAAARTLFTAVSKYGENISWGAVE